MDRNRIKGGIVGICVGDAVGLPVEYRSRNYLKDDPVTEMIGFGTHNMPPGTWSGDSSLALCTTECLAEGFSLAGIAARLVMYADNACWAASDEPVELPGPLRTAIQRLTEPGAHLGVPADGNDNDMAFGVLPRILPVAATLRELSAEERFKRVAQVASLTNGHMKVVVGCHILTETAHGLIRSLSPVDAFRAMKVSVKRQLETEPALASYLRVLDGDLWALPEGEIVSDGKIVSTVEAALWCLLTSDGFAGAVLKAANLGGDTDTIGAVAGGLAGFAYGLDAIPPAWVSQLSRSNEILALAERLFKHVGIPK